MRQAPTRRDLLAAGAAAVGATACSRLTRRQVAQAQAAPLFPILLLTDDSPDAVAQFARFDPSLDPIPGSGPQAHAVRQAGQAPAWAIFPAQPGGVQNSYVDLDTGLRATNFDAHTLLPGAMAAFTFNGQQWALPVSAAPIALRYQPAAFAAAGVPAPTPTWTLDDFTHACAAIQAAVSAGTAPKGIYGPLQPVGQTETQVFGALGLLADGILAQAFAAGHGGWLVRGGQFDFTNSGAVAGLSKLVDIARAYAGPAGRLPRAQTDVSAFYAGAAMDFASPVANSPDAPQWRYARFPRLPVAPVVPSTLQGAQLVWENPHGVFYVGGVYHNPPQAALDAITQYALWQYGRVRQNPAAALPPPVVGDADVQSAYWSAAPRAAPGADDAADWRNYLFVHAGWPPGPWAADQALFTALCTVLQTGADLRATLTALEQRLNTAVGRQVAALRAQHAALQQQPSSAAAPSKG